VRDRRDTPRDNVQDNELIRLEISEAAVQLGITPDGVRKRIRRGQLAAVKQDSRWYVVLDQSARQEQDCPETDETNPDPVMVELVATLKSEVGFLRSELDRRAGEIQELHVVIAQLSERVPRRLEAPTAATVAAAAPLQNVSHPRWWRFWTRSAQTT
jgi:hypothetical protein